MPVKFRKRSSSSPYDRYGSSPVDEGGLLDFVSEHGRGIAVGVAAVLAAAGAGVGLVRAGIYPQQGLKTATVSASSRNARRFRGEVKIDALDGTLRVSGALHTRESHPVVSCHTVSTGKTTSVSCSTVIYRDPTDMKPSGMTVTVDGDPVMTFAAGDAVHAYDVSTGAVRFDCPPAGSKVKVDMTGTGRGEELEASAEYVSDGVCPPTGFRMSPYHQSNDVARAHAGELVLG